MKHRQKMRGMKAACHASDDPCSIRGNARREVFACRGRGYYYRALRYPREIKVESAGVIPTPNEQLLNHEGHEGHEEEGGQFVRYSVSSVLFVVNLFSVRNMACQWRGLVA